MSSHNLAINTTNWHNLQEGMKICKNCERKEIQNKIDLIFSCDKYDNIQKKAFNDIK